MFFREIRYETIYYYIIYKINVIKKKNHLHEQIINQIHNRNYAQKPTDKRMDTAGM